MKCENKTHKTHKHLQTPSHTCTQMTSSHLTQRNIDLISLSTFTELVFKSAKLARLTYEPSGTKHLEESH